MMRKINQLSRIAILSCVAVALCRVAHAQTAEQTSIPAGSLPTSRMQFQAVGLC
ncbi:MAG: hypothetical protein ACE5I1_11375 [bacterium]